MATKIRPPRYVAKKALPPEDDAVEMKSLRQWIQDACDQLNKTPTCVTTAAQFDKTNDAALADVTGLSITLETRKTYVFKAGLHVTPDAVGGHQYAISGTATASAVVYQINAVRNDTNAFVINSRQTALAGAAGAAGGTAIFTEIEGTITVSAKGTLTVQFAQNAATPATTSSVLVGSYLLIHEL